MSRLAPAAAVLAGAACLAATFGCYSPNPASGTLKCGTGLSCPEGYSCADGRTCWKNGQSPTDGAPTDGSPTDGGPATCSRTGASITKFVHHWNFSATSTTVINCSDNSTNTLMLGGDFVDVTAGVIADLSASYYCDWNLRISQGNTTTICPGQSCTSVDTTSGTMYTWHGDSFNLTTADGTAAMLSAMISADFKDPPTAPVPNQTGTCTLRINGTLTPGP